MSLESLPSNLFGTAERWWGGHRRGFGLLIGEVAPAWLAAIAVLPYLVVGGVANPWSPVQPVLRGLWYSEHQLLTNASLYQVRAPLCEQGFSLGPIAGALFGPLVLGTWFGWQLLWPLLQVGAQQMILRRLGVPRGWPLALLGVVVVVLVAATRVGIGQASPDVIIAAMVVADLKPSDDPTVPQRFGLPPGVLLGVAAAVQFGPLVLIVIALISGHRRFGLVAAGVFMFCQGIAALVLPWDTADFWELAWHRQLGLYAGPLDPRLSVAAQAWWGGAGQIGGVALGVAAGLGCVGVAVMWARHRHDLLALGVAGLGMALALPPSWSGGAIWAVIGAAGVYRASEGNLLWLPWMAWLVWILAWPADLIAVSPLASAIGLVLGVLAVSGLIVDAMWRLRRPGQILASRWRDFPSKG